MDEENPIKKFIVPIALSSIGCMPLIIGIFVVFIGVLFILGIIEGGSGGSETVCVNVKSVDEMCESITVTSYGTMSVDEYVAHVVNGEVGLFAGDDEVQKALAIAARTFALYHIRNNGCVVSDTTDNFQVFDKNASENSIRIAEETSGIILVDDNGNPGFTQYDSISISSPYAQSGDTVTLKQRNLTITKSFLTEKKIFTTSCSENSLNSLNTYKVYGCGHGVGMSQWGAHYLTSEKGYTYDEVLEFFYGEDSGYSLTLASTNGASSVCTSSNNGTLKSLDSYTLNHTGLTKLNKQLSLNQIEELENFIEEGVESAGYGTGAAVASAGQNLTYGLEQYGYYLGYYWGGGHKQNEVGSGVITDWGKDLGIAYTTSGNKTGPEYGMDCSGFVGWSIRQACKPSHGAPVAAAYLGYGKSISLADAKPGDVMANSGHVILIIKNNGDNTVTTAESTFGGDGLIFRTYSSPAGYTVIDMSNWYANNCENISAPANNNSSNNNSSNNNDTSTNESLEKQIDNYLDKNGASGDWAVYVKNLKTKKVDVSINEDDKKVAASEIKLFIMASLYDRVNKGTIKEKDISEKVKKMITVSDNDATNDLIKNYGMDAINDYISNNHYNKTELNRYMLSQGKENYTSAQDIATLLEKIYKNQLVNKKYSQKMLNFLKSQELKSKIPSGVPSGIKTASKTGELSTVENDAAIVYGKSGDYIIVVLSDNLKDTSTARTNIKEISSLVYEYYN